MNLILSDRYLDINSVPHCSDINFINLSELKITSCIGCFGCWTKTPGCCVIRDDAVRVYPLIAASRQIMYVSQIRYGCYDTVMKTMLERAIPIQQAFIRLFQGETHHLQRNVAPKKAVIIGYGNISFEEQELFRRLVARNAKNMNFIDFNIIFAAENKVEEIVKQEMSKWEK